MTKDEIKETLMTKKKLIFDYIKMESSEESPAFTLQEIAVNLGLSPDTIKRYLFDYCKGGVLGRVRFSQQGIPVLYGLPVFIEKLKKEEFVKTDIKEG